MSTIKITIKEIPYNVTEVKIDGKLAYHSDNHPETERENIQRLFNLMVIENVEVEVK